MTARSHSRSRKKAKRRNRKREALLDRRRAHRQRKGRK